MIEIAVRKYLKKKMKLKANSESERLIFPVIHLQQGKIPVLYNVHCTVNINRVYTYEIEIISWIRSIGTNE